MPFDWKEFLVLARKLETMDPKQFDVSRGAVIRCAVSRAYFAAFGHALQYATLWLGFQPTTKVEEQSQDNGRLKAFLRRKRFKVAAKLEQLRDWRNRCDYETDLEKLNLETSLQAALDGPEYVFSALVEPQSQGEKT